MNKFMLENTSFGEQKNWCKKSSIEIRNHTKFPFQRRDTKRWTNEPDNYYKRITTAVIFDVLPLSKII